MRLVSNMKLTCQIAIRQIERGIAATMSFTIFTILLAFSMESFFVLFHLLTGDELGKCNLHRSPPCVFSTASTPIFTLIGNDYFFSCHTKNFSVKIYSKKSFFKNVTLGFVGYLGEIVSDSRKCFWTCCISTTAVPRSVFPIVKSSFFLWLTRFDFKNIRPFFGWPTS